MRILSIGKALASVLYKPPLAYVHHELYPAELISLCTEQDEVRSVCCHDFTHIANTISRSRDVSVLAEVLFPAKQSYMLHV